MGIRRVINQIPNGITLLALSCGILSVLFSFAGEADRAAYFVLYAVMLDKLDGVAARKLHAQSEIGAQLDSFGDYTSFGVAPAFLIVPLMTAKGAPKYDWPAFLGDFVPPFPPLFILALIYVCGAAWRLATFNSIEAKASKEAELKARGVGKSSSDDDAAVEAQSMGIFTGVPSTMAGGFTALLLICANKHQVGFLLNPLYFGLIQATLGYLMNSRLPLPKLGHNLSLGVRLFAGLNVVGTWACLILNIYPEYPFLAVVVCSVVGPLIAVAQKRRMRTEGKGK